MLILISDRANLRVMKITGAKNNYYITKQGQLFNMHTCMHACNNALKNMKSQVYVFNPSNLGGRHIGGSQDQNGL